jgi:hypothetical protein
MLDPRVERGELFSAPLPCRHEVPEPIGQQLDGPF